MWKGICILAASLLLLVACKRCEDKVCEALPETYKSWIPFAPGDTVIFSSSSGKSFTFFVNRNFASEDTVQSCFRSLLNCSCYNCKPYSLVSATGDSMRGGYADYYIKVSISTYFKNNRKDTARKDYELRFLDYTADYILDRVEKAEDSLIHASTVYTHTLHSKIDTLNPNYKNFSVSEIYLSKKLGVCAFYDRKSKDWFYRK